VIYIALFIAAVALVYLIGPRTKIDLTLREPELPSGPLAGLETWIADNEIAASNVIDGTESTIRWHKNQEKTEYVVLYLHGFSASRQELSPVPELIADAFEANAYSPRFSGHGSGPEAQANATVNEWLNDSLEAFRIAEKLGEKIILIGSSTGAAFATFLMYHYPEKFAASILFSPNFRVAQAGAEWLIRPWGKQILHAKFGTMRIRPNDTTEDENRQKLWTGTYPTRSLLPMIAATRIARQLDHSKITCPSMLIWSPLDEVIHTDTTREVFDSFGSSERDELVLETQHDPRHHLLTGDIMAPANTQITVERAVSFLNKVLH
jgi:esterase/lipase